MEEGDGLLGGHHVPQSVGGAEDEFVFGIARQSANIWGAADQRTQIQIPCEMLPVNLSLSKIASTHRMI